MEPEDAYRSLMMQWLTGDTSDGIPGIKGVGPKKAEKILEGIKTKDMEKVVRKAYADNGYPDGIATRDYKLLYMLQTWEEFNEYNEEEPEETNDNDSQDPSETPVDECDVGLEGKEEVQVNGVSGVSERNT
jgi:5'-3' exonuclease